MKEWHGVTVPVLALVTSNGHATVPVLVHGP
jgi:hypothetical protein